MTIEEDGAIASLTMGRVASFYYLKYQTMATLHTGLHADMAVPEVQCSTHCFFAMAKMPRAMCLPLLLKLLHVVDEVERFESRPCASRGAPELCAKTPGAMYFPLLAQIQVHVVDIFEGFQQMDCVQFAMRSCWACCAGRPSMMNCPCDTMRTSSTCLCRLKYASR